MKTCERCGFEGEFVTEEYGEYKITFCPDCYDIDNTDNRFCKHEISTLIKYPVNGKFRVQNMCSSCFKLHGSFIKQSDLTLEKIKTIDKEKHDNYHSDLGEKYAKRHEAIRKKHLEWEKTIWFSQHNSYLKSMQWAEKRDEVLRRDSNLCQSCLKRKATQVHHLTYKHWMNEPLFELISVCNECHQSITEMDQKNTLIA